MSAMTGFAPGEVARRTGLTLDTLRYYEREGLVGPIERSVGGQRRYDEDDVAWIGIVTCLRDAGLGIADLRRFTELLRSEAGVAAAPSSSSRPIASAPRSACSTTRSPTTPPTPDPTPPTPAERGRP